MAEVLYRNAGRSDLGAIARIFLDAFPESVEYYTGHPIGPLAIEDAFAIVFDAEPEAFFVAELNGRVVGYIVVPAGFSGILRTAVLHGHLLKMFCRWITGRYGVGLRPVWMVARNWLGLAGETRHPEAHAEARILSIAVEPGCQGLGIGSGLTKAGLDYLRSRGEKMVRLEVRPDNQPAIRVYEKYGFKITGETTDVQGKWLVMLLDLSGEEHG